MADICTDNYTWQEHHCDLWHCATFHMKVLPNVKSGSFVDWFEGLWCCWQSIRNRKVSLCPVFVPHHWCQVLVHIIHSQHGHLQKIKTESKWHHSSIYLRHEENLRGQPECFCQLAGLSQSHHHLHQRDWWSAPLPIKCSARRTLL